MLMWPVLKNEFDNPGLNGHFFCLALFFSVINNWPSPHLLIFLRPITEVATGANKTENATFRHQYPQPINLLISNDHPNSVPSLATHNKPRRIQTQHLGLYSLLY